MPRKQIKKKQVVKSNISRLINNLMKDGKKRKAENIVYKALTRVVTNLPKGYELPQEMADHKDAGNHEELISAIVDEVVEAVRPQVMVKSQRIGGANLQEPRDVPFAEGVSKAIKWIIEAARNRGVGEMCRKLSDEFLDVLQKRGGALRKREEAYKMAMANRVFATAR